MEREGSKGGDPECGTVILKMLHYCDSALS